MAEGLGMKKLRSCPVCNSYTLKREHCEVKTDSAHPKKFNPNDRYGDYRRKWMGY
jgi:H/ACA ribonucleoprotein complex subunit 3